MIQHRAILTIADRRQIYIVSQKTHFLFFNNLVECQLISIIFLHSTLVNLQQSDTCTAYRA